MKNIEFIITDDLSISSIKGEALDFNALDSFIYIYGDLVGSIIEEKARGQEETISLISNSNSEEILNFSNCLIGSFYLIIKKRDELSIIASCSSPGLIYKKEGETFYFNNSEKSLFNNIVDNELDPDVAFELVRSHQILMRSPFNTINKKFNRLPSASFMTLNQDKNILIRTILSTKKNETTDLNNRQHKMKDFSFIFENTIKLMAEYYQDQKVVLFSGGVDSSMILIAVSKLPEYLKSQIIAVYIAYNGIESRETKLASKLAKTIGINLSIISAESRQQETIPNIKKYSTQGMGVINAPQYLRVTQDAFSISSKSECVAITGQNADTLYQLDTFAAGSAQYFFLKLSINFSTILKRIHNTTFFWRSKTIRKYIRKIFFKKTYENSELEEIQISLSTNHNEHVPINNPNLSGLDEKDLLYKKIKYQNLFMPVKEMLSTQGLLDNGNYSLEIAKLFRWYRTVHNVPINYKNLQVISGVNRVIPFTEGPMANFLINMEVGIPDLLFPKKLFYEYFRKSIGSHYDFYVGNNLFEICGKTIRKVFRILKISKNKEPTQNFGMSFYDDLEKIKMSDRSLLLDYCNPDSEQFRYFEVLYKRLDDREEIDKVSAMELCRLVNLENSISAGISNPSE